jgi:hypothetical protein
MMHPRDARFRIPRDLAASMHDSRPDPMNAMSTGYGNGQISQDAGRRTSLECT